MNNYPTTQDLLIELGCEELPAKHLKKWQAAWIAEIEKELEVAHLDFVDIQGFITPRRMALLITDLSTQQPSQLITRKGPSKQAAFDSNGNPTKAAIGFAESVGTSVDKLSFHEEGKGSWLVYQQQTEGKKAKELLPAILEKSLSQLPMGKRMRWGDSEETFSRPIHWIVLLLDHEAIHTTLFGIKSSNVTYGHRFLAPAPITIPTPKDYEALLLKAYVVADFEKRQEKIIKEMEVLEKEHRLIRFIDLHLLDEVTGLIEWPAVLWGSFDPAFLKIPNEALMSSMQVHQKCFPVFDETGLLPHFLIVSNIQSKNKAAVIEGNECVMKARLADAAFYDEIDKQQTLLHRREALKHVRYQQNLGTLWDKTERLSKLAKSIAKTINADPDHSARAALLCKSDLLTQMVGEFPELQGIMGYYYAKHDQESNDVARAIFYHYYPRVANDALPATPEATAVALADRLDTLAGLFALGHQPTGDKDPFALRRQALGMMRILIEKEIDLDLNDFLREAMNGYADLLPKSKVHKTQPILEFCFERLKTWYHDQGVTAKVFAAVYDTEKTTNPLDFDYRIQAVTDFATLPEAESLAAANKRVYNILSKNEMLLSLDLTLDKKLLLENSEKNLAQSLLQKETETDDFLKVKAYTKALKNLATLKDAIDLFFTEVMVMVDDEKIRDNRLKLLQRLRNLFLKIADISLL